MPKGNRLWKKRKFRGNQHRPMFEGEVLARPSNEAKTPPSASRRKIGEIPDISDNVGHNNVIVSIDLLSQGLLNTTVKFARRKKLLA